MPDLMLPQVQLTALGTSRSRKYHPWFMWKEVEKSDVRIAPGMVADLIDTHGRWQARGFYNGHARVRFRVLTRDQNEPIDDAFFKTRIAAAIERRSKLQLEKSSDAYRLVHSEADGLSGLVVDRYGALVVLQFYCAGMMRWRRTIREVLRSALGEVSFYGFAERHVQKQESYDYYVEPIPAPVLINENALRFTVSPGNVQKTGFFADQRDNRLRFSQQVYGRRVLDLCCHTGGFALYAKVLGFAKSVDAVDWDENSIAVAKKNAELNQAEIQFHQADVFEWLQAAKSRNEGYDAIVLDPPKQTRSQEGVPAAERRYFAMNQAALAVLNPGGLLVSCSCSGLVSREKIMEIVKSAAKRCQRQLQILEVTGAGADHPVSAEAPESDYLKVIWARVD